MADEQIRKIIADCWRQRKTPSQWSNQCQQLMSSIKVEGKSPQYAVCETLIAELIASPVLSPILQSYLQVALTTQFVSWTDFLDILWSAKRSGKISVGQEGNASKLHAMLRFICSSLYQLLHCDRWAFSAENIRVDEQKNDAPASIQLLVFLFDVIHEVLQSLSLSHRGSMQLPVVQVVTQQENITSCIDISSRILRDKGLMNLLSSVRDQHPEIWTQFGRYVDELSQYRTAIPPHSLRCLWTPLRHVFLAARELFRQNLSPRVSPGYESRLHPEVSRSEVSIEFGGDTHCKPWLFTLFTIDEEAYNFSVRTTQESRDHLMQLACLRYHTVKVPLQDQNFLRIFFSEVITSSWRSIGTGAPEAASRKKLHMYVKLPAIFRSMVDEILEGQFHTEDEMQKLIEGAISDVISISHAAAHLHVLEQFVRILSIKNLVSTDRLSVAFPKLKLERKSTNSTVDGNLDIPQDNINIQQIETRLKEKLSQWPDAEEEESASTVISSLVRCLCSSATDSEWASQPDYVSLLLKMTSPVDAKIPAVVTAITFANILCTTWDIKSPLIHTFNSTKENGSLLDVFNLNGQVQHLMKNLVTHLDSLGSDNFLKSDLLSDSIEAENDHHSFDTCLMLFLSITEVFHIKSWTYTHEILQSTIQSISPTDSMIRFFNWTTKFEDTEAPPIANTAGQGVMTSSTTLKKETVAMETEDNEDGGVTAVSEKLLDVLMSESDEATKVREVKEAVQEYSKWEVLAAVMELPRVAISKCNNDEGFKLEQALAAIQFIIDMPYTLPALPDRVGESAALNSTIWIVIAQLCNMIDNFNEAYLVNQSGLFSGTPIYAPYWLLNRILESHRLLEKNRMPEDLETNTRNFTKKLPETIIHRLQSSILQFSNGQHRCYANETTATPSMRGRGLMISGSHLNNLHRYLLTLMTREGSVSLEQTMLICHKTLKHVTGSRFCAAVIKEIVSLLDRGATTLHSSLIRAAEIAGCLIGSMSFIMVRDLFFEIINFLSTQSDAHGQFIIAQLLSHVAMQAVTYNLSGVKDKRGSTVTSSLFLRQFVSLLREMVKCSEKCPTPTVGLPLLFLDMLERVPCLREMSKCWSVTAKIIRHDFTLLYSNEIDLPMMREQLSKGLWILLMIHCAVGTDCDVFWTAWGEMGGLLNYPQINSTTYPDCCAIPSIIVIECKTPGIINRITILQGELNGTLSSLGNLSQLENLALTDNRLSGNISFLTNLTKLRYVNLSFNRLSGPLPDLSKLTALSVLILRNNSLSSIMRAPLLNTLPQNLTTLDLSGNDMIGSIPQALISLTKLNTLALSMNRFSGEIPPFLFQMGSLNTLVIDRNGFTSLPRCNTSSTHLTALYAQENHLEGNLGDLFSCLPQTIGQINLSRNSLSGAISILSQSVNLSFIDLSYNNFTGTIPSSMGTIHVDLSHNLFDSIQDNRLDGIPQDDMHATDYCDISGNKIPYLPINTIIGNCKYDPLPCSQVVCPIRRAQQLVNVDLSQNAAQSILNQLDRNSIQKNSDITSIMVQLTEAVLRNSTSIDLRSTNIDIVGRSFVITEGPTQLNLSENVYVHAPSSVLKDVTNATVTLSSLSYDPFPSTNTQTYGRVIGVNVYNGTQLMSIEQTRESINISMGLLPSSLFNSSLVPVCLWWKENGNTWERGGCNLTINGSLAVCHCNHLTNFTLGADAAVTMKPQDSNSIRTIIIIVCCVSSAVLLSLSLVAIVLIVRKRKIRRSFLFTMDGNDVTYDVVEKIYKGRDTEIWKAVQSDITHVAIKTSTSEEGKMSIIREIEKIKLMHHPNIVQYLGQKQKESVELVMEFMSISLDRHMHIVNMTTDTIVRIAHEVARGMSYVVEHGLVHTRLTADHILMNDGQIKITGFSHFVQNDTHIDPSTIHSHTAPEVVKTMTQNLEADVYTFGLLLLHLLTLSPLYENLSPPQLLDKLRSEVQVTVEESWDPQLKHVIQRCTSKYPKQRPSFRELSKLFDKKDNDVKQTKAAQTDENMYALQ